ncbi:BON domain-containing protein, partial [Pasteurella multocida]
MGLFDFVSDIGRKLFSKQEDAAEALAKHIKEDNPGIEDLNVKVEDGVASIEGTAKSASALEKAVLMAGNVAGITKVKVDKVVIVSGESLS